MTVTDAPGEAPVEIAAEDGGDTVRLGGVLDRAAQRLRAAGIDSARRDARLLLAAALGIAPERVLAYPERPMMAHERTRADALIARRLDHEPVSRILGRREFWGLTFRISPEVLDPRPESETIVEAVLERIGNTEAPARILDLGTGSGCLLLALLSALPAANGLGTDLSTGVLRVARANAEALGLAARARFARCRWAAAVGGRWQVIVSNPPYITEADFAALPPEVAHYDPRLALCGGADGLEAYRALVPEAAVLLAPGGLLALEVGMGQAGTVETLIEAAGLTARGRVRDLAGIERCVLATRPGGPADGPKKWLESGAFPTKFEG